MDDLKERMREWWEYDPGHLIPQALTRIETLEAQLAKADALADAHLAIVEATEGLAGAIIQECRQISRKALSTHREGPDK